MKKTKMKRDNYLWINMADRGLFDEARERLDQWTAKREETDKVEQATLDELTEAINKRTCKKTLQALTRAYQFVHAAAQGTRRTERTAWMNLCALMHWNDSVAGRQARGRIDAVKLEGKHKQKNTNAQGQTVDICREDYIKQRRAKSRNTHNAAAGVVASEHGFTCASVKRAAERGKWFDG